MNEYEQTAAVQNARTYKARLLAFLIFKKGWIFFGFFELIKVTKSKAGGATSVFGVWFWTINMSGF